MLTAAVQKREIDDHYIVMRVMMIMILIIMGIVDLDLLFDVI